MNADLLQQFQLLLSRDFILQDKHNKHNSVTQQTIDTISLAKLSTTLVELDKGILRLGFSEKILKIFGVEALFYFSPLFHLGQFNPFLGL